MAIHASFFAATALRPLLRPAETQLVLTSRCFRANSPPYPWNRGRRGRGPFSSGGFFSPLLSPGSSNPPEASLSWRIPSLASHKLRFNTRRYTHLWFYHPWSSEALETIWSVPFQLTVTEPNLLSSQWLLPSLATSLPQPLAASFGTSHTTATLNGSIRARLFVWFH